MSLRDTLLVLVVVALWGINFVSSKIGVTEFPPLFLMFLRFTLVAAVLLPFVRVPWGKLRSIAILALILGGVHFPLMFSGIRGLDAATTSVVAQLQVPFASLLAALFFRDTLGWRRAAGMVVAFAGVVLIAGEPRLASSLGPLLMVVGASLAFAAANVQIKRLGAVDGFTLNAWMALFAAPLLLVLSLILEDGQWQAVTHATWQGWAALLYIVVAATIIAYGLWYYLIGKYDVNQAVPYMLLIPVFGVLSGVAVLGEPLTWTLVIGGLLTVAGVGVIVIRKPTVVNVKTTSLT